jgi:hypothetical protein
MNLKIKIDIFAKIKFVVRLNKNYNVLFIKNILNGKES